MVSEDMYAVALTASDWWSLRNVLKQAGLRACEAEDMDTARGIAGLHREIKRQARPEVVER